MTKYLKILIGAVILAVMSLAPVSYGAEQPIYVSYKGTILELATDFNNDGMKANVVQAPSKGSFGASMSTIVTEFVPYPPLFGTCPSVGDLYLIVMYSSGITSFLNGDQLDASVDSGWMCIDMVTGEFEGVAYGVFVGGTGRFANATGDFESPFRGKNLAAAQLKPTAVSRIEGEIEGTVELN